MSKRFWVFYTLNVATIFIGLLAPVVKLLANRSSSYQLQLGYYAVLIALSVTLCIPFLCLNIYGAVKCKRYRARYYSIAALLVAWIIWGIYQIVYAYLHDISI